MRVLELGKWRLAICRRWPMSRPGCRPDRTAFPDTDDALLTPADHGGEPVHPDLAQPADRRRAIGSRGSRRHRRTAARLRQFPGHRGAVADDRRAGDPAGAGGRRLRRGLCLHARPSWPLRGYVFTRRAQNVVVTYTAGYAATAARHRAGLLSSWCASAIASAPASARCRGRLGGGETVSFSQKDMSDDVKLLLVAIPRGRRRCRALPASSPPPRPTRADGGGVCDRATIAGPLSPGWTRCRVMRAALAGEIERLGGLRAGRAQTAAARLCSSAAAAFRSASTAVERAARSPRHSAPPYAAIHEYGGGSRGAS